jgi:L-rhamnose mutarotase
MKKIILILFLSFLSPKLTFAQIIILKNCYTIGHTPDQTEFYKRNFSNVYEEHMFIANMFTKEITNTTIYTDRRLNQLNAHVSLNKFEKIRTDYYEVDYYDYEKISSSDTPIWSLVELSKDSKKVKLKKDNITLNFQCE